MDAVDLHLALLDPALSGSLFEPFDVDDNSGLPTLSWWEGPLSEAERVAGADPLTEESVQRAEALDPALGARQRGRRRFAEALAARPLTLVGRAPLQVQLRRRAPSLAFQLTLDRWSAQGTLTRLRVDVEVPSRQVQPTLWEERGEGQADAGLQHVLARHLLSDLATLQHQVESATGGRLLRLSRGTLGPFWFPGVRLPEGAPPALGSGLLLHLQHELTADDVVQSAHRDPFAPPAADPLCRYPVFVERRFAASAPVAGVLRTWASAQQLAVNVAEI